MVDSPTLLAFLSVLSLCAMIATVVFCFIAADLRRMSKEAQRLFSSGRSFLDRANRTASHLQRIVDKGCDAAEDALEEVSLLGKKTPSFLTRYFGNGTKPRSARLHHRND